MTTQTQYEDIKTRLYNITFANCEILAKRLAPTGKLGFAPLQRYKKGSPGNPQARPLVHCFADYLLGQYRLTDIAALLPEYEARSRAHKAHVEATRGVTLPTYTGTGQPVPTTPYASEPEPEQNPTAPAPLPTIPTPATAPAPAPMEDPTAPPPPGSLEAMFRDIIRKEAERAAHNGTAATNADDVARIAQALIDSAIENARLPRQTHVVIHAEKEDGQVITTNMGLQHKMFTRLLKRCMLRDSNGNRLNIWLSGPAGSGKTTAAKYVAKALSLDYFETGALDTEYKLLGFTTAMGVITSTSFRKAWEQGGVFLFDEIDASMPGAIMALNAALANGRAAFPDGSIERHKDCVIIAAANTWGSGATFEYVGRNKLDAASLDRFIKLPWDYDNELEIATSGNETWARKVIAWRNTARTKGVKVIISPRATYFGSAMLADGIPESEVVEELITAGMTEDNRRAILGGY